MSRRPVPRTLGEAVEWVQGDSSTGEGIRDAMRGVDVVVNCTGNARDALRTDVLGVRHLAEAARAARVRHFFHVSIVGADRIVFDFYEHKIRGEDAVRASGTPFSIQRVTQFHALLDRLLQPTEARPDACLLPLPGDAQFQPIDTRDVADYLLPLLLGEPAGMLPDVGGPEVLRFDEIARAYWRARGIECPEPRDASAGGRFPPSALDGFRRGLNTVPDRRHGTISWAAYVAERYRGTPPWSGLNSSA
jgi:uncharacterized protein YbjT (DUF2867 family)